MQNERDELHRDIVSLTHALKGHVAGPSKLTQLISGVLVIAITGLGGWVLGISQRVTGTEARLNAHHDRIDRLESGATTPMAAETRRAFEAVNQSVTRLEHEVAKLADRIYDRRGPWKDGVQ